MVMPPVPPIPIPQKIVIKVLKEVAKAILPFLFGSAKKASEADSTNNSSLENIDNIMEIFSGIKDEVRKRSLQIEESVEKEVDAYLDEIRRILEENQDVVEKYGVKFDRIERRIDKIRSNLHGIIDREVSKAVSLDNSECRAIMKMIPGERKENALRSFLDSAVQNALSVYCSAIRKSLDEIFDDTNEEILGTIEVAQQNIAAHLKMLRSLDENNRMEVVSQMICEAGLINDECEIVENLLEEV